MQDAGLDEFIPHGQLSLAYAQSTIGRFTEAEANITASEMAFAALGDRLNLARCRLHRSSILRRQGRHQRSLAQRNRPRPFSRVRPRSLIGILMGQSASGFPLMSPKPIFNWVIPSGGWGAALKWRSSTSCGR